MFTVITTLTLSLAKAMGVYMIAAGAGGLLAPERWRVMIEEIRAGRALTYLSGVAAFAIGASIVMAHNIWTDPLSIVVTLVGWIAAIEGVVLIVMPAPLLKFSASMVRPGATKAFAAFALVFGALLLIAGLIGRAG